MSRKFRDWQPEAGWLFPPSPQDWLPEDHLVYFLLDVVQGIDVSPIIDDYASAKGGQPPFHPRMMLVLLLYWYCVGVFSSRKIMQRCETDVAFRVVVGEDIPNFRRVAEFRKRHLQHMQPLFLEVLVLCREAGLLKVGRLSLDGTKVKANASRHKAMSYDRMTSEVERLQKEINQLLAHAEEADDSDDNQFGDLRGDEIPDELARRESRLQKIEEAKAALEEKARLQAEAHVKAMEAEGRTHRTNPEEAVPKPKDQRNFTDPESKIMKTSNKGFDQCGNAQAVANEEQIIVSADVTDQANDSRQAEPMVDQTLSNLDEAGIDQSETVKAFTADAGYFSESNMNALDANQRLDNVFIATGRQKHNEPSPVAAKGRPPNNMTAKQKMARRNRTKKGQKEYARRKAIIEPVFGQIKHCQGFRQFLMRGLASMQGEWTLVCLTHNLRKLFKHGVVAAG
jgi:transposase